MQVLDKAIVRQQLVKYLELRLAPIPLQGKVAKYPWREFELTEALMQKGIQANVNWGIRAGFVTPGVFLYFIDLDSKAMIGEFMKANILPNNAPLVSTGKGFHWWLTWTQEVRTRHFTGLDIIGNGYVVVPPSLHASGKPYCFIRPLGNLIPMMDPKLIVIPVPLEASTTPNRLVPLGRPTHTDEAYAFSWDSIWHGVPEGRRHNTLIRYLGILHVRWHTQSEALAKALEWNLLNRPPLPDYVIEGTVKTAWAEWNKRKDDWYDHEYPISYRGE